MISSESVSINVDTTKFQSSLEEAGKKIRRIYWDREMRTQVMPAGYGLYQIPPDWEARLWDLTSKLAVKMADRCQEGLMTPEEFGVLSHSMAAWTVKAAIEAQKPKPLTDDEIQKLMEEMQK